MKKLFVLSFLLFNVLSYAQIKSLDSTYINDLTKDIAGTYKEIVKSNLQLTEEQADIFWPLFENYLKDFKKNVEDRVANTEEYMMNYYSLDNATAKELLEKSFDLEQQILDLKKEYMKKMVEKLPASVAGKFFQIDARVFALINTVRMSSIPLVRQE